MIKKLNKKLPIDFIKEMKDFIFLKNELFTIKDNSDKLIFHAVDNDPETGFYFIIESHDVKNGYLITYKPQGTDSTSGNSLFLKVNDMKSAFLDWYKCLVEYAELENEFKDPFLKNLKDQFLEGLNLDKENKNEPLTLKEVFLLEGHLSTVIDEIRNYENDDNREQIAEIIEEATNLRSDLGNQTKEWIAKKFSSILAKITKEGPEIFKGIFKEAGKQIMTQGIKFLLEHGDKLIV